MLFNLSQNQHFNFECNWKMIFKENGKNLFVIVNEHAWHRNNRMKKGSEKKHCSISVENQTNNSW